MKFTAVILAGGRSSRMGRDKASLELHGQTLLARQIHLAHQAGAAEILISGRPDADYPPFNGRVILDRFPGSGPLAGIESALAVATQPLVLVLAVDMPYLNVALLQKLGAQHGENIGAIPRVQDRIEPLAAVYPRRAQPLAEALLARNPAGKSEPAPGPTDFARLCVERGLARWVDISAAEAGGFRSVNTPADLPG